MDLLDANEYNVQITLIFYILLILGFIAPVDATPFNFSAVAHELYF